MTVRQRGKVRRAGIMLACVSTIIAAIFVLFASTGNHETLANATTGRLLALVGLFVVPPLTFAIMRAEQRYTPRRQDPNAA